MRIRMNSIITAAAVFAIITATLIAIGQGAPQAPAGQQPAAGAAPARGGGAAAGGGRGGGGGRGAAAPDTTPVPRLSNGKPDLSGHWQEPYTSNMAANVGGQPNVLDPKTRMPLVWPRKGEALTGDGTSATGRGGRTIDLPFTELGLKRWKEYDPVKDGDYTGNCLPFGMSRNINSPHGSQLVHSVDALAFLWEQNTWFTFVPIQPNGVKWPADLPESWNGLSVGHWDGDTLVIETTRFNGYTKLDTTGHPHSKDLVLTNTFLRTGGRTMQHTVTVHDPKIYSVDWMNVRTWTLKTANDVIMEYSCEENNGGIYDGSITPWKKPEVD